MAAKVYRAIGLMSGTSADGVDAAYLETDGHGFVQTGEAASFPYDPSFRRRLLAAMGDAVNPTLPDLEHELTEHHARAVELLLLQMGKDADDINIIGFHGQTIFHDPANRKTLQIGDGALLANLTGIDVINDFRSADVAAGGQGAPLVPLYHAAIAYDWEKPIAIVNIGGVANITFVSNDIITAFDCGPGNALMDDAMQEFFGMPCDMDGGIAAMGSVDDAMLADWIADDYFSQAAPKSLDRNHFKNLCDVSAMMPDEALATLCEFTARSIISSEKILPATPTQWIITGGGRKNPELMRRIAAHTKAPVKNIDDLGWNGDALEAQAFAYLAVRSKLGLPLSLPTTTGVPEPTRGGKFYAKNSASTP